MTNVNKFVFQLPKHKIVFMHACFSVPMPLWPCGAMFLNQCRMPNPVPCNQPLHWPQIVSCCFLDCEPTPTQAMHSWSAQKKWVRHCTDDLPVLTAIFLSFQTSKQRGSATTAHHPSQHFRWMSGRDIIISNHVECTSFVVC